VHGRQPTREELADALATTVDEVRRRQAELAVSDVGSLNTLVLSDDDTDVECIETLMSDDATTRPEEAVVRIHAKEKFRRAFARLPRREREVAVMLYLHNMTLREVGDVLGVSESRVCQIHGALKGQIRRALAAEEQLFSEVA
jgi:RNA polymerase sigma factor for flagellar operon FliA